MSRNHSLPVGRSWKAERSTRINVEADVALAAFGATQLNVSRYTEADGGEVDVDRSEAGWLAVAFARRVSARSDPGLIHCSSERGCVAADSMGPREAMLEARRPRMGAGTRA